MTRTGRVGVGFIGAGMISEQYLTNLTTFPDVEVEHLYIDNAAMQVVSDPRRFDVVVLIHPNNPGGECFERPQLLVLHDALAFLPVALLDEALGLHIRHVPPRARVLALQGNLGGGGSMAGGQLIVPQVPRLAGVESCKDILGVADGDGLAPSLQCLGCQFQPAREFLDNLGRRLPA